MKRAFEYKDEKSHKLWWVEYENEDFVVNYGKWGTIGKFQIKEFDTEEQCKKAAEKLIASKIKKGYSEVPGFDFNSRIYIDDEEIGLHPKTSHPNFRSHFTNEFYYDCVDEEAPFGSDEGNDTLSYIHEDIRKNENLNFADFPKLIIEKYWDMEYLPADDISKETIEKLMAEKEMELTQSDMVTYAVAFGQIKVTGKIDQKLKELAINAIRRFHIVMGIGMETGNEITEIGQQMINDLESFNTYS